MSDLEKRVAEANNLIKATVKRIRVIEPESTLWACDVDALRELIKELSERERRLVIALKKTFEALEVAEANVCAAAHKEITNPPFEEGVIYKRLVVVRDALAEAQTTLRELGIEEGVC